MSQVDQLSDVVIRVAACGDLDALAAIETQCFEEAERWSASAWREELAGDNRLTLVAEVGEVVAAACFHVAGDSAELYNIMTAPQWQGFGLATLLLARGFDWASQQGATQMLLEVRVNNGAQALYADVGFTPLYERTNYYGPGLHALVMRRELKGADHV
ncbi:MAG: GNAT family N-acetyltransferase [Propionibacteriaceae bacterium]|nr:GNAT family N-acetyltransferase [Propionibacteriaceae bacterium]